jgi:hypothetical protein
MAQAIQVCHFRSRQTVLSPKSAPMKLKSFQIKNYKVIDDTGPVKVEPTLTALVGRNESGKTAILKALWKSRNIAGATFDKLYDFPRDRYPKDRSGNQVVAVLEFALSDQEAVALVDQLPSRPAQRPTKITWITRYEGQSAIGSEIIFESLVAETLTGRDAAESIGSIARLLVAPGSADTGAIDQAASSAVQQIEPALPLWTERNVAALESFAATVTHWVKADEQRQSLASTEMADLQTLLTKAKQGDPTTRARAWAEANLPTFIYYDDYGRLETLIHLPSFLARQAKPDPKTRAQSALFELTGLDPNEILALGRAKGENETEQQVQRRLEERRALLRSASLSLTGDWVELWTGDEHRLEFDADGDYLVLQVSDSHSAVPVPFEERSQGFQWFLSFYLIFLVESRKAHKDAILLLDEPGLHLHPTLQARLIKFLERISEANQILYTTHLPFLVDGSHFEQVRTVFLTGSPPRKAVVSEDLQATSDPDTLFPLQAALGHAIAQSLFLSRLTLIVEGLTDFWLLRALHSCLAALKDADALMEGVAILPAGGAALIAPLGAMMLASTGRSDGRMLILLNSDHIGRDAARQLETVFGDAAPVITVAGSLGMDEAMVDDLVLRDAYGAAVQKTYERQFTLGAAEIAAPTNLQAMDLVFRQNNWGRFGANGRAATALWLTDHWAADTRNVSSLTLDRARKLFREINRRLSAAPG